MKAVQFQFGSGDHTVVQIPKPVPAKDEVLVRVKCSALDTAHQAVLQKEMSAYFIHNLNTKAPLHLGYHYAGTVEAVGADVTDLPKGTDIFGFLQYEPSQTQGAFAEYITVKSKDCAIQPAGVSDEVAAASATESATALQALRDLGGLRDTDSSDIKIQQRVLLNGAGGGVGSAAVQIAKQMGAHVTAVCSSKDVDKVQKWGADAVVDRTKEPNFLSTMLAKQKEDKTKIFDVIFDVPNVLPSSATRLLHPRHGVLVNTIPTATMLWNKLKTLFSSKTVAFVECHSKKADLMLVGQWLEDGALTIPVDSIYKVNDLQAAVKKQAGAKKGRVVIQIEDGWQ